MPQPLEAWQDRLERHFTELTASRVATSLPIFALEHPLDANDFQQISQQLRSRLAGNLPLDPHWLLWVVYATEQGYAYDGQEYWDSFEHQTPHWRERASRQQLKLWFHKFRKTYNGVEPSGAWADCFNIISWPIRHAILPKYLQLQFAEALYNLRFKLARLETLHPKDVGELLASNTWNASSRFREFLQQEELAGRILLALLNRQISDQSPIYAPTLSRIVSDVEGVHKAREWLKEARRTADQFKGVGRSSGYASAPRDPAEAGIADDPSALRMRPSLLLRRADRDSWSVILDVPDFSGIAAVSTELAQFLKTTRSRLSGEGVWHPASWLLSGSQRGALKSWPDLTEPVLKFERSNGIIDNILNADFRLSPIPQWLFRISDDGLARQIVGLNVRPGHRYVLVTREPVVADSAMLGSGTIHCDGVNATLVTVPEALSADDTAALNGLNLQVNRTIRAWPAGFLARSWDGDGYSEWLTTEAPSFGVAHDHPVAAYHVRLDNDPELIIQAQHPGRATFVQLPRLSPGRHHLRLRAQRSAGASEDPKDLDGVITLDVRDPIPWRPGTTAYSGLFVSIEPADPSLDAFGQGAIDVSVQGPEGRQVTCRIALTDRTGTQILSHEIGRFDLPLSANAWMNKLGQFLGNEGHAWKCLEASSGLLSISNEELGQFVLRLERDIRPVRWVCRNAHHTTQLRLIDDTGVDAPAVTNFRSFQQPASMSSLGSVDAASDFRVSDPGGLYEAQQPTTSDALIVSTPHVQGGLQGLLVKPNQSELAALSVRALLDALNVWTNARLAGPLAANRRDHVIRALLQVFYAKLCGDRWVDAETTYLADPTVPNSMDQLQRLFGRKSGFGAVLRRDFHRMEEGTMPGANWFAEVAGRYDICSEPELCELALRTASEPVALVGKSDDELASLVARLAGTPEVIRGARLLALCAIAAAGDAPTQLIPRWKWQ
jgi:hypothetical protein